MIRPVQRHWFAAAACVVAFTAPSGPAAAQEMVGVWPGAPADQAGAVSPKSPGVSALLSFLVTGAGQVYNEEGLKGGLMFGGAVIFTVMAIDGVDEYDCDVTEECWPWLLPVGLTGALGLKIWSIVDATSGARRWNQRHGVAGLSVRPAISLAPLRRGRWV